MKGGEKFALRVPGSYRAVLGFGELSRPNGDFDFQLGLVTQRFRIAELDFRHHTVERVDQPPNKYVMGEAGQRLGHIV